jgi:predicted anti-sigma-YlaC factor YlaD
MDARFGSWPLGMWLGASALGGMLGMASGIFIVLAATTFASALLYAISGFGFAVLAAPLFLLFLDPARAIQLVIIISTVLLIVVLRSVAGYRAVAAAALGTQQSCWAAARPRCLSLC